MGVESWFYFAGNHSFVVGHNLYGKYDCLFYVLEDGRKRFFSSAANENVRPLAITAKESGQYVQSELGYC
jgi:hypothetical protein